MTSLLKSVIYGAIDACTAGRGVKRVIQGESVRFPARWSRYYSPDYEPHTFAFLRRHCKLGQTVFDIGAHLGLFTVVMARLVGPQGRVCSFEPTPLTRGVLQQVVQLNGCADIIEVRQEAVAQTTGEAIFFDTGHAVSNANSLVNTPRQRGQLRVATVSIDDFVLGHGGRVDCLKIDVEGAELGVLRGAEQTLKACRPAMALSLHPDAIRQAGGSLGEIWDLLQEHRMSIFHKDRIVDQRWFSDQEMLFDVHVLAQE